MTDTLTLALLGLIGAATALLTGLTFFFKGKNGINPEHIDHVSREVSIRLDKIIEKLDIQHGNQENLRYSLTETFNQSKSTMLEIQYLSRQIAQLLGVLSVLRQRDIEEPRRGEYQ